MSDPQKTNLLCPQCDEEAEFVRGSGMGGITLQEIFTCQACSSKIERLFTNEGKVRCVLVEPITIRGV